MQVKNIIVNDLELLMDELIRTLIKLEISYVRIDNEIHFDNYIYRFYDIKDFEVKHTNVEDVLIDLATICVMPKEFEMLREHNDGKYHFLSLVEKEKYIVDREVPSINKKMIKAQNKMNNRLVNTSRKK